jgi:hypothetical protein
MLRLIAFAALCAIALANSQAEVEELRALMDKRISLLEEKIANGVVCVLSNTTRKGRLAMAVLFS